MRAIAYLRASTEEQERSGLGLQAQESTIRRACTEREWELVRLERDIASGGKRDRAGLGRALEALELGEADCVVVSRLDRLGRSVAHVAQILERHPGAVVALDIGLTPDSPAGAFTAHVIAAAAELERALIRERTRDALHAARERGVQLGRPREVPPAVVARIRELRSSGLSLAGIARRLDDEELSSPRGGKWFPSGISRVLSWSEVAA
jgi:DNA invertase Pin-like site-specific DNA recombinase